MKKIIVIWVFCGAFLGYGQEVNKEFTKLLFNEQFDLADKNWSSTFNADNLFIAQNGYYELYRRSKKSGYYLFPNQAASYSAFQLEAALMFGEHGNRKQSAGLIVMANAENGGGLSVEINARKEYRIVRVYKDRQVPLNGSSGGWTRASHAISRERNTIVLKTYNKVYDLYINGIFLQTFTDIELNRGGVGIYVGPDSKVKFDYLTIHGEQKPDLMNPDVSDAKGEEAAFTQIILRLKEQINKKDKEIDDYKTRLKLCENNGGGRSGIDTAALAEKSRMQARIAQLESENEEMSSRLLSMEEELAALRDFKSGVEKGNDGDIVINLTNMVSNQKNTIEALEKQNKSLNSENNSLFMETKDLSKQLDKTTSELSAEKQARTTMQSELDSLKKTIRLLKDSLARKSVQGSGSGNPQAPEKELSEEEKLQQMIEKEREERRKRREEEERRRKEEEGKGSE